MKKTILFISCLCLTFMGMAQKKVAGVTFENHDTFGKTELTLNGAGIREKLWIDLYAGALYVTEKSADAETIINANSPMAVRLHIVSGLISSKKMIAAVEEGFENSTKGNTKHLRDRINQFIGFFKDEISKGDVFDIVYDPTIGIVAYKNGEKKGTIEGLDFKKALFGIWLSNRPADDNLKEAMLGK